MLLRMLLRYRAYLSGGIGSLMLLCVIPDSPENFALRLCSSCRRRIADEAWSRDGNQLQKLLWWWILWCQRRLAQVITTVGVLPLMGTPSEMVGAHRDWYMLVKSGVIAVSSVGAA
jgi:hypothetical protein